MGDGRVCGTVYTVYVAARSDDIKTMRAGWDDLADSFVTDSVADSIDEAVDAGDTERVTELLETQLFVEEPDEHLDGFVPTLIGTLLWGVGYVAAFVLFFRAHSAEAVVSRLRWAYGVVGVSIQDTEAINGVQRTTFCCPYRNIGAERWGQRRVCHDVLDRVDDGYVTFLERHRDLDYDRPLPIGGGTCCYSEVSNG